MKRNMLLTLAALVSMGITASTTPAEGNGGIPYRQEHSVHRANLLRQSGTSAIHLPWRTD